MILGLSSEDPPLRGVSHCILIKDFFCLASSGLSTSMFKLMVDEIMANSNYRKPL